MSSAAATHCLVAVVGGDPHVKLCDPATGGFTHSLVGHREPVWAVSWSLESEYHLVTGGCDGQVLTNMHGHCFSMHGHMFWEKESSACCYILISTLYQHPSMTAAHLLYAVLHHRILPAMQSCSLFGHNVTLSPCSRQGYAKQALVIQC